MNLEHCGAYELVEEHSLPDIHSAGFLLRHKRTGARVALISNDDENKVFYIGFRTPPKDSTGVAHIVEHTVLCGSEQFPVKDPFVELVKGSLNTFLNAMTYPDKTLYPVASVNDRDFKNLMHVYLDAVFRPNIYQREEIFWQEGWHYELARPEYPITLNGVVYNEMKGAYSSPEGLLDRQIIQAMNPENAYAFSAAGEPGEIPKLTRQEFLDFHRKYYHPSNSYIYLYGDMDMEERLNWIDQEYLSKYDYLEVDSAIGLQKPFSGLQEVRKPYSVADGESLDGKTYLSLSFGMDTAANEKVHIAFDVLEYALLGVTGAPLKQALLDAGIGKDITSSYRSGFRQPIFSIVAKNSDPEKKEEFLQIIRRVLKEQASGALNKISLEAGLNRFEFDYREADFGQFPKGLLWGIRCMDSWLYADHCPFIRLTALPVIRWLREQINTGYFEGLIREYLLENPHQALVILEPEQGYNARQEQRLTEELAAYKASLTQEEITRLVENTARLKRYQEEPSTQEELKTIPMLSRKDLKREAEGFCNEERTIAGVPALYHPVDSNGIVYMNLLFDTAAVAKEDIPYLGILKAVLGYVDTDRYSYQELANEKNLHTGGIKGSLNVYSHIRDEEYVTTFQLQIKVLSEKVPKALELAGEILAKTRLTDSRRIYEILARQKNRLREHFTASGDNVSSLRAMSYFSGAAKYRDLVGGIGFYRLVSHLEGHYEEEKERLAEKLEALIELLFRRENLMVSVGGAEEDYRKVEAVMPELPDQLWNTPAVQHSDTVECSGLNEGFLDASQVQYVSRAGNFKKAGYEYTGAFRILQVILGYEYLWQNIRVKGGAYGCKAGFSRNGDSYFSSYRDPNLERTNEIFEGCAAWLKGFDIEDRDMGKYIIGAISDMDHPLTCAGRIRRSLSAYFTGLTQADLKRERDQVLDADQEDIRRLAGPVESILRQQALCVIGNEDRLKKQEQMFHNLQNL